MLSHGGTVVNRIYINTTNNGAIQSVTYRKKFFSKDEHSTQKYFYRKNFGLACNTLATNSMMGSYLTSQKWKFTSEMLHDILVVVGDEKLRPKRRILFSAYLWAKIHPHGVTHGSGKVVSKQFFFCPGFGQWTVLLRYSIVLPLKDGVDRDTYFVAVLIQPQQLTVVKT